MKLKLIMIADHLQLCLPAIFLLTINWEFTEVIRIRKNKQGCTAIYSLWALSYLIMTSQEVSQIGLQLEPKTADWGLSTGSQQVGLSWYQFLESMHSMTIIMRDLSERNVLLNEVWLESWRGEERTADCWYWRDAPLRHSVMQLR